MKWLLFTSLFPQQTALDNGLFNLARINALKKAGEDVSVIVPIDLTPHMRYLLKNLSLSVFKKKWLDLYSIPEKELFEDIPVYHPKWYSPPRSHFWKHEYQWLHLFCSKVIEEIIKAEKPDIMICSWLSPFGIYSTYIKKEFNIPVFVIPEGDDLLIYPEKYPGWNQLSIILNDNCDRMICASQYMFDMASGKRNLNHCVKVPNGFDHTKFNYLENQGNASGKVHLLCVGYLDHVKGQDILIQAMAKLDDRFDLTLVGNGTLRKELEKMVQTLGLQQRIHFAGFQNQDKLISYYHEADIFCLASRSEGFGISILEAMACGLPVVASDAGGIPEKITEGRNGFIVQKENIDEFVQKISDAAITKWDRSWIAENVRKNYSWEKWASEMMSQYDEVKQGYSR